MLTVLFYAGVHDQGYGYFLDVTWPSWVITILDVGAAGSLWWAYRRGRDRPAVALVLTGAACAYVSGRMAWTLVVPVVALIVLVGAIVRPLRTNDIGHQARRTADRP